MRLFRLYTEAPLQTGQMTRLDSEQAHYLKQVLRLGSGDDLILFNGTGGEYSATITELHKAGCCCKVETFSDIDREMDCEVRIIQAASRNEKIETALQKGTELGAASFEIVVSERSQLRLNEAKLAKRLQRWRKIITEAAEQSGRTRIPSLAWRHTLQDIEPHGLTYALHPDEASRWENERKRIATADTLTFAIGPEGGWGPHDLKALRGMGFGLLGFGARIMRTETAAPALLAATQAIRD